MEAQPDLFPSLPVQNYRHSDPAASKSAGKEIERTGKAQRQRERVLGLVVLWPGRTSKELGQIDPGLDRYAVARRLPELLRAGMISRIENGECRWWRAKL